MKTQIEGRNPTASHRRPSRVILIQMIAAWCLCMAAYSQVPDLTAGGTPTSTKKLNLGPTGAYGWLYHKYESSSASRQILVQTVDAGSPADGTLAAGDVILGVDGTGANPVNFSSDARKTLGLAIADAEARNPATLKLLRWRAGVTTTETITLQTMGAYSATAPYNCPKSALILEQGLDYVMANQNSGKLKMGLLALLAANNPADPDNAARLARAQADALSLMPTQAQINDMLAGKISTESKIAWAVGHKLLVLSEYYLSTGDAQVLPGIEAFAVAVANGQSALGTMGHQFTSPGPDGSLNGTYNVGYGCVNSAGMPAFLSLLLAKQCGLTNPEIDPAIARASRFFAAYSDYSCHPYGEHEPYRQYHESNGKSGLAAICFSLQENRVEEEKFYAQMATAASSERNIGHTGPWFNYLWSPLGAAMGGEEAAAEHFSRISWDLDLSRRWDGGFVYNDLYGPGADSGTPQWQTDLYMSTPALLTYALPLRQLVITGKNPDTSRWLNATEVADAVFAGEYNATSRTTQQLVADLGLFSPKVQYYAAKQLGLRTAEHATLVPQLIAIANDTNAGEQRVGACLALGDIKNGSAAVHLAALLTDSDDEVRFASAEALRFLPQADRLAQVNTIMAAAASTAKPFYPIDEEDPIHFAHHRLCMLLFYGSTAYGPSGVIWGNRINGIDRNLLYPAIRAVAANPNGQARSTLHSTYPYLTQTDVDALAGAIVDSVKVRAPADKMFSGGVRTSGLSALQSYNIAEGVPIGRILAEDKTLGAERKHALDVLTLYAGDSTLVNPDPKIAEFCEFLVFTEPTLAADAQEVLSAIAADTNPVAPRAFKTIQSISVDNPNLTLPAKHTKLHVSATDFAQGNTIYTWRKVHGAGNVTFTPNSSGAANNTTIVFDGLPGQYLFEVTMSDSRALTEAVETVAVTLYQSGGGLPANSAPTATPQTISIPQSTTTPFTLTGSDPEGYELNYSVTSQPTHGKLGGEAPYLTYTSDFGYSGPDSFTFEVMDSEGQTSTATIDITVGTIAGLETAVYEPFDYPNGALNGRSGSSEVGFASPWVANASTSVTAPGSLTYGSLMTEGGRYENLVSNSSWIGTRAISTAALADNGLLNDGSTLWFSAVVGNVAGANLTNVRLAMSFGNSGFSQSNYKFWINNEGSQLGSGVGFTLGRINGINGRVVATQFQDLSKGDQFAGNILGSWEGNGAAYGVEQYGLIVGRITWAEDPEMPDRIEIFQPQTNLELPSAPISVLETVLDQSTFDTLSFTRVERVKVDEIRFGANYHSVLAGNQPMSVDLTAPNPDPVAFHTPPTAIGGTSITMAAAPAYDLNGMEYYFTCTAGGGNDSGWQNSASYTDTGLTPGVQYSYTVTARDRSPAQNATTPSAAATAILPTTLSVPDVVGMDQTTAEAVIATYSFAVGTVGTIYSQTVPAGDVFNQSPVGDTAATVGSLVDLLVSLGQDPDQSPPTPSPLTFAIAPHATGATSIAMTATTASDESGVEYYFTCTSGGGNDSGWQDNPEYEDTGLTPVTTYSYTVTARDKSTVQNTTSASAPAAATTDQEPDVASAEIIPITSFNPATFFSGGITAGIDFDVDSSSAAGFQPTTQSGFLSVPANGNKFYNVTHNGITFDIQTANANQSNVPRWRGNALAGDLTNDFQQFTAGHATSGNALTATVTLTGLSENTDYEVSFFTYNVGASQSTHSFYEGTSTSDPLITTFTTAGNQNNYSTWVPGITFGLNSGASGTIAVTIQAPESLGSSNWESRVTLNGVSVVAVGGPENIAPVASDGSATTDEDAPVAITLAASDIDSTIQSYSIASGPSNGTLSGTAPNFTYTPNANFNGTDSFTFTANDGTADSNIATVSITVNAVNDVPIASDGSATTDEDTAVAITLAASDIDSTIQSYTVVSAPTKGTLSGTAPNLTYTPNANTNGADSFTFKANDGAVDSNIATVSLTVTPVNDAPVASNGSASTLANTAAAVTLSASDIDSTIQSYTVVTAPANGTLSGTAPNLTYTPNAAYTGADTFTFTASDGTLDSNVATLNITVSGPGSIAWQVLNISGNVSDISTAGTLVQAHGGADLGTGDIVDGSTFMINGVTFNDGFVFDSPSHKDTIGNRGGSYPAPNAAYGTLMMFADRQGAGNATFTFNNLTIGSTYQIQLWHGDNVSTAGLNGLVLNNGGTASTPVPGTPGHATLLREISEGGYGQYAIGTFVATATTQQFLARAYGSLTTTPVVQSNTTINGCQLRLIATGPTNSAPVVSNGSATTNEDTPVSVTLVATDANPEDILAYTVVSAPTKGTLSGTAPNLTYTPNADANGADSFTFKVNDGTVDSNIATVSITVNAVNDVPIASDNSATTDEDTAVAITLAASDIDSTIQSYAVVSSPANGTLSGTAPNLTYTPNANFNGADSFTFTANDGAADSNIATASITVNAVNDVPIASDGSATTNEDTAVAITLVASDIDSTIQSYAVVSGPANGTLSGTAPNLTYTPNANFNGADSFTFKANDGMVDSNTATVGITVNAVNDAPFWTSNPVVAAEADEGVAYSQTLAGMATDPNEGGAIAYSKVSGPAWLSVAIDGTLSGTPPSGSAGLNSFVVRATDSGSATADATLEITVNGLPLPWIATDIGTGMLAGSTTHNAGTFTQAGSGIIGGTSDKLRFTYQTITGDGEIIARISSLQNTGTSARVGVMIRDSLASNSKQIFMGMAGNSGYRWLRRSTTGGSPSTSSNGSGTVPNTWVRIVRTGSTIASYKSTNGTSWTLVDSSTNTTFASTCYVGLAVGSGSDTTLNTSQFSNVTVTP